MNRNASTTSNGTLPDNRHVEQKARRQQNQENLDVTDRDVGDNFADHHFAGPRRRGQQVFHRAALAFARDGQGGDDDHRHGQHDAHQAGHDVILGDVFRIVMLVHDEIERRRCALQVCQRSGEVAVQHGGRQQDSPRALA